MGTFNSSEAKAIDRTFNKDRAARFPTLAAKPRIRQFIEQKPAPSPGEVGYEAFAREVLATAFYRDRVTIEDTIGERMLLAWRMTRDLARHMNLVASGESLTDALRPNLGNLDPWKLPSGVPDPLPDSDFSKEIVATGSPAVVARIMDFENRVPIEDRVCMDPDADEPAYAIGLPVLPPDRDDDSPLWKMWMYCVERIASNLGLSAGTPAVPDLAEHALPQLMTETRQAWPSRMELVTFEEILISETVDVLIDGSQRTAMQHLRHRYGLLPHEQRGLVEMARVACMEEANYDVDEARGVMVMRLERFIERSRQSYDLRAELGALKQMALVQGLARSEANDLVSDFTNVVRSVSASATRPKAFEHKD